MHKVYLTEGAKSAPDLNRKRKDERNGEMKECEIRELEGGEARIQLKQSVDYFLA